MAGPRISGTVGGALVGGRTHLCCAFVPVDDSRTIVLSEGGGVETLEPPDLEAVFVWMRVERRFFHGKMCLQREFMKTGSGGSEFTWRSDESQGGGEIDVLSCVGINTS